MRLPMAARGERNNFRGSRTKTRAPHRTPLPVWLSSGSVQVQFIQVQLVAPHHVIPFELSLRLKGCQTSLHHVSCAHIRRPKPAQCRSVLASSVDSDGQYGSATKMTMCATRFPHLRTNTYCYGPSMSPPRLKDSCLRTLRYRRLAELGGHGYAAS